MAELASHIPWNPLFQTYKWYLVPKYPGHKTPFCRFTRIQVQPGDKCIWTKITEDRETFFIIIVQNAVTYIVFRVRSPPNPNLIAIESDGWILISFPMLLISSKRKWVRDSIATSELKQAEFRDIKAVVHSNVIRIGLSANYVGYDDGTYYLYQFYTNHGEEFRRFGDITVVVGDKPYYPKKNILLYDYKLNIQGDPRIAYEQGKKFIPSISDCQTEIDADLDRRKNELRILKLIELNLQESVRMNAESQANLMRIIAMRPEYIQINDKVTELDSQVDELDRQIAELGSQRALIDSGRQELKHLLDAICRHL